MDDELANFVTSDALRLLTDTDLTPNGHTRPMEKAKADHLLRHLQLRLRYARLKVDHGWQKQRLPEVENLYFRQQKHSDATYPAGAVPSSSSDPQLFQQSQMDNTGPNSSVSFKLGPSHVQPDGHLYRMPHDPTNGSSQMDPHAPPEAGPSTHLPPHPHRPSAAWGQQRFQDPGAYTHTVSAPIFPQGSAPPYPFPFWSSGAVPAAPFAPPPTSAPRNGKGKGRVNGGSVTKRKSPVVRAGGPG
ncbi:hypothetical protein C8R47DRAFT_665680 [Mycena vitilis]|nr:hypothetical protein C8R47DRAFT_665680 [Mycena vitilis]